LSLINFYSKKDVRKTEAKLQKKIFVKKILIRFLRIRNNMVEKYNNHFFIHIMRQPFGAH